MVQLYFIDTNGLHYQMLSDSEEKVNERDSECNTAYFNRKKGKTLRNHDFAILSYITLFCYA